MENNTFAPTGWDERIVAGSAQQPRFTYAHTTNRYTGIIEGDSVCDYLLYYTGPGYVGTSTGIEYIDGTVRGRAGSFLIQHEGRFDENGIEGTWRVLSESGTGQLRGICGTGSLKTVMHADAVPYTFDYDLL